MEELAKNSGRHSFSGAEILSEAMTKSGKFVKKYFYAGQILDEKVKARKLNSEKQSFFDKNRRLIATFTPGLFVYTIWLSYMSVHNLWHLFKERAEKNSEGHGDIPHYYICFVMMLGSFIGGATSEGSASVAFPVMTLAFKILPRTARDFSFMIQSIGMTSASTAILIMGIKLEPVSLIMCTIGGTIGIIFGLELVTPYLPPPFSKMYFVSVFFAFAVCLYILNRDHERPVFENVVAPWTSPYHWKPIFLLVAGFVGGIFSAISGSGLDIFSFSSLTLLFRVSEKVATSTSVILMAINTVVGFLYREFYQGGVDETAWGFWACAIPVATIAGPVGATLSSHVHRLVLAALVYILDTAALISALVIIKPWTDLKTDKPLLLSLSSLAILIAGMVLYWVMAVMGEKLLPIDRATLAEEERARNVEILEMGSLKKLKDAAED